MSEMVRTEHAINKKKNNLQSCATIESVDAALCMHAARCRRIHMTSSFHTDHRNYCLSAMYVVAVRLSRPCVARTRDHV